MMIVRSMLDVLNFLRKSKILNFYNNVSIFYMQMSLNEHE